ncbi:MAG: hypothetical protein R2780_09970 [Crocinitomicaceae bacterium]|nr:hypothetical protein [Crocinitomicaceae bacterium]
MRSELEQIELIDQYLSGKMSAEQVEAFEAQMAQDPALKSMVKDQQLLIQTVSRQALMAEINAVASLGGAATATGWGLTQWLITVISVATLSVGALLIYNYSTSEEDQILIEESQEELVLNEEEVLPLIDSAELISFQMDTEEGDEEVVEVNDGPDKQDEQLKVKLQLETNDQNTQNNNLLVKNDVVVNDQLETKQTSAKKLIKKSDANLKATYPGGRLALEKFVKKELKYPRTPYDKGIQGTVKVTFIVTADGKITELSSNCFILKDREGRPLSTSKMMANKKSQNFFEENAERIFRISQPWEPATDSEGNPVLTLQTWYVNYDINGKSSVYPPLEDEGTDNPCKLEAKDWEKVEVRIMNVKDLPKNFVLKGENIIEARSIKDVEDLSTDQYREICQDAAKNHCCVVYLDVNHFWSKDESQLYYNYGYIKN